MKKIVIISSLVLITSVFIYAQEKPKAVLEVPGKTSVKWEKTLIDFKKVKYKVPATAKFIVENTGDKPVMITNVKPSCGCTNVKYPKDPIKPGNKATVQATYDAAKVGGFSKSLTVHLNIEDGRQILRFKGTVVQ